MAGYLVKLIKGLCPVVVLAGSSLLANANPLLLSITPRGRTLEFYWSTAGTNYLYTLEGSESLDGANWFAIPCASWPLQTNHWTVSLARTVARFYRVKAEPVTDPGTHVMFRTLAEGSLSGVTVATNLVIGTETEWLAFWQAHLANSSPLAPPAVDFTSELVVAVTLGQRPTGGYAIVVDRIEANSSSLKIFVMCTAPFPGDFVTQAFVSPFHFVAVPRTALNPQFMFATCN